MSFDPKTVGFRLSRQQDRLWRLQEKAGRDMAPLLGRLRLEGQLDAGRLQNSLRRLVSRHEALRTRIVLMPGTTQPIQVINAEAVDVEELRDCSGVAPEGRPTALAEIESEWRRRDLRGDALRAELVRFSADVHYLLIAVSPFCCDYLSLQNIVAELAAIYDGAATDVVLAPEPVQYADYAAWQEEVIASDEGDGARYWQACEQTDPIPARLALETSTGDATSIDWGIFEAQSPQQEVRALHDLAKALDVEPATLLFASWTALLQRHTPQRATQIHFLSDGRSPPIATAIGAFGLTLPLRCVLEPDETFAEFVQRLDAMLQEHRDWQDYVLADPAHLSGAAVAKLSFEHVTILQPQRAGSIFMSLESPPTLVEPFRLHLQCLAGGDGLQFKLHYDAVRFSTAAVECIAEQWLTLLASALRAPNAPIERLPLLGPAERERLLGNHLRALSRSAPEPIGLHTLLERQAELVPQAVVLRHGEVAWTYAELNRCADSLAVRLLDRGLQREDRVGLLIRTPPRMIVAMFAVLKAGGTYVPLDPAHPAERVSYVLQNAAATLVLTEGSCSGVMAASETPSFLLDDWLDDERNHEPHTEQVTELSAVAGSDQLAYVIYTSGSTGAPKGVGVSHGAALSSTLSRHSHYSAQVRGFLLLSSFSFDSSVAGVFWTLSQGGCLCLPTTEELQDPAALACLIERHELTHLLCLPSFYALLLDQDCARLQSLEAAIVAGESCPPSLPPLHRQRLRSAQLYNEYGPTEAAVWSTVAELARQPENEPITIGSPIESVRILILDERQELAPRGVAGELYIGGAGLARGYLGRADLTAERFLPDPFGGAGARLYRTGDLARHRADGDIEFLGRIDHQVKIRGFRIELGEIEAALSRIAGVREAAVLAREDQPGDKRLVAYVAGREGTTPAAGELRAALQAHLPDYMLPSAFVTLDALPLTANGKVDRKALPAPDLGALQAHRYVAPRTATEAALCRIWAQTLGLERVGVEDNFFELGGHSLLAVTLIERMRQEGLQADVRALFVSPTPAALAAEAGRRAEVLVPPNLIAQGCAAITPEMLPLAQLSQGDIDRVVGRVPGGASNVQDIYPLTPLQEGILFHHLMAASGDPYLTSTLLAFDGRERLEAFLVALQAMIARHDILRTAVAWEGLPEPVQVVWRAAPLSVEEASLDPAAGDVAQQLRERFDPRRFRLDVRQAPLLRGFLAYDAPKRRWLLLLLFHHLIDDNTTLRLAVEEAQAHLAGEADRLSAPASFRNFVAQARLGVSPAEHEAFFQAMLGDVSEPTAPFGLVDAQGDGSGIDEARLDLAPALARRLRERARALGVSAASLCHQAFAQVLARVSGREDVVFGTVLFGRMQGGAGADRALGMFINTLPVRAQVGAEGVADGARRMHGLLTDLLRHEHASLALAQRCSGVAAPAPLFSALLNFRHSPAPAQAANETSRAWSGIEVLDTQERTNYPLTLSVDDLGEGVRLTAQTQSPLDPNRLCAFMQAALERLVAALETEPNAAARTIDVLPEAERRRILVEWNQTAADYPRDRLLHELFEDRAAQTPAATAVVFEDAQLAYGELNARANQLAHHLRSLGVGPDALVGICVERSLEMVVGLLAILKAGGAYLPLDPDYPRERIGFMLEDAKPRLVLTQARLRDRLPERVNALLLDAHDHTISTLSPDNPVPVAAPHNLAYVIYTSGSTGAPKGVGVSHGGIVNRIAWMQARYELEPSDAVLQKTPSSFDVSVWEFFWPLAVGARLVVAAVGDHRLPQRLAALIEREGVTTLHFVPSMLQAFVSRFALSQFKSLRRVICSGEALPAALARRDAPQLRLHNLYGPTEASVDVTAYDCGAEETTGYAPIGRPIWNTQIYLLDGRMQPVPIGAAGELYIGGAGLARGYLGRADLTAERFLPDPFGGAGARLYRTGDLARHRADGDIEFLGRIDHQVKIRGFRIELGEIEAALSRIAGVREAAVLAREDQPGDKRLVAYVAGREGTTPAAGELRAALQAHLPDYMLPSAFVTLDALPLTANGKVDRKALPAPDLGALQAHRYVAPRTATEAALCRIWAQTLGLERVGVEDNFFELGGHSLLAVQVASRIRTAFGIEFPLRALFEARSIAEIDNLISAGKWTQNHSDEAVRSDPDYEDVEI
ncbi:non-ribosomal peptide synthetase [Methylocystis bryophila]|uniref:Carrier domain-containing protein n=1 Tax=Methylocystis bryophila TaxID=655015 RepID=A0A1W6N244_9HYPH|nr:non-ribosomal peptide synthetase [Methylocystis bryophila]ARN83879.1 hypothetical protein B1812_21585 [Methylocystis bryophila]